MTTDCTKYTAWIDGVGAQLLCLSDQVSFGGPTLESAGATIRLMANLSRCHATIERAGEVYRINAHSRVRVGGREVGESNVLNSGYVIELGEGVRVKFRIPTALSVTAVLDFLSDHRPAQTVDGIVLMSDNCLLGPGPENHIRCPAWQDSVVLFRRDDQLWCKSRSTLFVDGKEVRDASPVQPGSIVSGEELRFRLEEV